MGKCGEEGQSSAGPESPGLDSGARGVHVAWLLVWFVRGCSVSSRLALRVSLFLSLEVFRGPDDAASTPCCVRCHPVSAGPCTGPTLGGFGVC